MKNRLFCTSILLSAALLVASAAAAQDQRGTPNRPGTTRDNNQPTLTSNTDKLTQQSFTQQAYEANQNEVKVAQLAKTRASSANVKRYAQQLETDHTKAMDMLRKHASNLGVTLPTMTSNTATPSTNRSNTNTQAANQTGTRANPDTTNNRSNTDTQADNAPTAMAKTADSAHLQELSSKSGAEFDRAFIDMMVEDHQKAISLFERANTEKFTDAGLRGFVSSQLPGLRNHLNRAQQLQKELGSKTTTDANRTNIR
jgi:putative membrane protein